MRIRVLKRSLAAGCIAAARCIGGTFARAFSPVLQHSAIVRIRRVLWQIAAPAMVVLAYLRDRGYGSKLRPLQIFDRGWGVAVRSCLTIWKIALGFGLVFLAGAGLQIYFSAVPGHDARVLIGVSIGWQALSAILIALLAVPVHLFTLRVFLSRSVFYGGDVVNPSEYMRPRFRLLLRAAAYGFCIWLLTYGFAIAFNALAAFAPGHRSTISYASALVSFLIMTLVCLVRPALSIGSSHPLKRGLEMAWRNSLALFMMAGLFAMVSWLVRQLAPLVLSTLDLDARMLGVLVLMLFGAFQALALEAATVIFMHRAIRFTSERTSRMDAAELAVHAQSAG